MNVFLKRLKHFLKNLAIALVIVEIILWIVGYRPYYVTEFEIKSNPEYCLIPDSKYGFALQPGQFDITLNKALQFNATHLSDSTRATQLIERNTKPALSISFFGCSYTYGWGVSDSATYPFQIQKSFPHLTVRNYGVPGYGTIQSLLQLQELARQGKSPDIAIINYAHFHNERNALTRSWKMHLKHGFEQSNPAMAKNFGTAAMPFADLDASGNLMVSKMNQNEIYTDWPGRTLSPSINRIQTTIDRVSDFFVPDVNITKALFLEIKKVCDETNTKLLVCGITDGEGAEEMLRSLKSEGIKTLDISVDLSDPKYNNQPYDSHPNALAHSIYAKRVEEFLSDQ